MMPAQILICDWGSAKPLSLESLSIKKFTSKIEIVRVSRDVAQSLVLMWAFNEVLAKVKTLCT